MSRVIKKLFYFNIINYKAQFDNSRTDLPFKSCQVQLCQQLTLLVNCLINFKQLYQVCTTQMNYLLTYIKIYVYLVSTFLV